MYPILVLFVICLHINNQQFRLLVSDGAQEKETLCIGQYMHCVITGDEDNIDRKSDNCRVVNLGADPRIVHRSLVSWWYNKSMKHRRTRVCKNNYICANGH